MAMYLVPTKAFSHPLLLLGAGLLFFNNLLKITDLVLVFLMLFLQSLGSTHWGFFKLFLDFNKEVQ